MLERIKQVSSYHNVSGSENQMRSFIKSELEKYSLEPMIDETDCIYTFKKGTVPTHTVLICVPMDLPGYLALFVGKEKAVLVPTGSFSFQMGKSVTLLGENNAEYKAAPIKDGEPDLKIQADGVNLGDSFRLVPDLKSKNNLISGYFAGMYALIANLLDLCGCQTKNNVVFLFTQGNATNSAKEKNIIRRIQPDFAVFLSSFQSDKKSPLVMLKDGKSFSSPTLVSDFIKFANEMKIKVSQDVSAVAVSKSESVFASEGLPHLSLCLPHTQFKDGKQSIDPKIYRNLVTVLKAWL